MFNPNLFPGIPLKMYGVYFFAACNGLHLIQLFTYFRCVFTDPGRMRAGQEPIVKSPNVKHAICDKSKTWKPVRAHYCRECRRCIFKMDHHCPWVNNCIGHRNMKYFMLLNLYTCLSSLMLIASVAAAFINLVADGRRRRMHMRHEVSFPLFLANLALVVHARVRSLCRRPGAGRLFRILDIRTAPRVGRIYG